MRIFHVITALNRGGAENHLADLVHGQLAAGHQVGVAFLKGDGWWSAPLRAAHAEVFPLGMRRWIDPFALLRLVWAMRRFRPDVVHGHLTPTEPYAWAARAMAAPGSAFVISKHNDDPFDLDRGYRPITRHVTTRAHRTIAISRAIERGLPRHGVDPTLVRVVHYGIDAQAWANPDPSGVTRLRELWGGGAADAVLIGCVARLVPQKAHDILLSGFARAAKPHWRLILVGSGPLEPDLRHLADRLGISEQVVWAGQRSDMVEVMGSFDVLALTSIYEGLGLVLLEAMAAGRAVVASAVSAIPEIVGQDGGAGLLIPSRDPAALAAALQRAADPDAAAGFGRAGRRRVETDFTIARMVTATEAVYTDALHDIRCRA